MFYSFKGSIINLDDISAILEPDGYYRDKVTVVLKNGEYVSIRDKYEDVKKIIEEYNTKKGGILNE